MTDLKDLERQLVGMPKEELLDLHNETLEELNAANIDIAESGAAPADSDFDELDGPTERYHLVRNYVLRRMSF